MQSFLPEVFWALWLREGRYRNFFHFVDYYPDDHLNCFFGETVWGDGWDDFELVSQKSGQEEMFSFIQCREVKRKSQKFLKKGKSRSNGYNCSWSAKRRLGLIHQSYFPLLFSPLVCPARFWWRAKIFFKNYTEEMDLSRYLWLSTVVLIHQFPGNGSQVFAVRQKKFKLRK